MIERSTKKFEYNLESLRGFAALFVVFQHVFGRFDNWLDPGYRPSGINKFETPGHLSVLIFFTLSGYVIGINHKSGLTASTVVDYLKRRFVRLYPIYIISIIATLIVADSFYPFSMVISHLTFTQVLLTTVFGENTALWSLHYEVLFYLLFIPLSLSKVNPLYMACLAAALGIFNSLLYPFVNTPIVTSYMYGFTFWLSGLIIAKKTLGIEAKTNFSRLVSCLLLILAFGGGVYNILIRILDRTNILANGRLSFPSLVDWYKQAITFTDFSILPYSLMFVLIFTGKSFLYSNRIFLALQLLPLLAVFHVAKANVSINEYLMPTVYYVTSLFLYVSKFNVIEIISKRIIDIGVRIGSLSYALYVIHLPILYAFKLVKYFSGELVTYSLRLAFYLIITFTCAFLLELKMQPWIKRYFFPVRLST